jgi:hypothetical protein
MKPRYNRLYNKLRRKSGSMFQSPNYLMYCCCKIISTKLKNIYIRSENSGAVHCSSGTCVIHNKPRNEIKAFRWTWLIFRVHTVSCSYAMRKFWRYGLIIRETSFVWSMRVFLFWAEKLLYDTLYIFLKWVIRIFSFVKLTYCRNEI